jgi:hypothetical protein
MKKLLIIVLFSTFSSTFGQDYKPLLDNYNEWHVTTCFFGCLTDKYFTAGDTIVGATDYKVLDGYHYISRTFLLREELLDRKVYMNIVSPSGNNEYLLYNFSMIVGDSIDMKNPITPFPENAGYYRLDSIIPRPLADGEDYRHFYLSPALSNTISNTNAIWVEGAGSLSLINAPSGDPDINGAGSLSCSFKNSIPFYRNLDSIASCEPLIVLGLNEFNDQLSEVQVNTLVTDKYCHLTNVQNARFIDVYDLNGRRLIDHSNNGKREVSLDFSNLKSGVYILVMNTNQFQKRTFKVIVK